jgi:hypothetical protein
VRHKVTDADVASASGNRQSGGGLAVASLSANAYAQCAVLCEGYCKDAVSQPRDWN